jgi:hypothetical protein
MSLAVLTPSPFPAPGGGFTPRVGSPRRAAILTALTAAAMETRDLKGVLALARTGRPRSLIGCGGRFRWLALSALTTLYPEANEDALKAALGCRASKDRRQHEPARAAALAARERWPDPVVESVARAVIDNEDAQLTAAWVWPIACAVTAAHTGAEAAVVRTVTGTRASPPRPVSQARKLAVYLTMTEGDVNATAMAAATGLNKETVKHHAHDVEDRRDEDPALDQALETLAAELRRRLDEELSQW